MNDCRGWKSCNIRMDYAKKVVDRTGNDVRAREVRKAWGIVI